jgi:hypothetical protein
MFLWSRGSGLRVRMVAIGQVKEELTIQGQREEQTGHLSSFSRMIEAHRGHQAGVTLPATVLDGSVPILKHRGPGLDLALV